MIKLARYDEQVVKEAEEFLKVREVIGTKELRDELILKISQPGYQPTLKEKQALQLIYSDGRVLNPEYIVFLEDVSVIHRINTARPSCHNEVFKINVKDTK